MNVHCTGMFWEPFEFELSNEPVREEASLVSKVGNAAIDGTFKSDRFGLTATVKARNTVS
jgi:hypothetical protein